MRRVRHMALVGVVGLLSTATAGAQAGDRIWESAIQCAALDLKRADLLETIPPPLPDLAGTLDEARTSARTYLRIAAEALNCPDLTEVNRMLYLATVGTEHRMSVAAHYGIGPEIMVLALASEAELTCALYIDPETLAEARAAETASARPACGW